MRREISKSQGGGGFSVMLVALIGLIGILFGYFIKKT